MQSYAAARTYFKVLEILAWCVIVLGGLVAIGALIAISQMSRNFGGSALSGIAGLAPGVAISFLGFVGLVVVQIGRAGVDSAEYGQLSLDVARKQLEVSKQMLNAGRGTAAPSLADLNKADQPKSTTVPSKGAASYGNAGNGASKATRLPAPSLVTLPDGNYKFGDRILVREEQGFSYDGVRAKTPDALARLLQERDQASSATGTTPS